MRLHADFTIIAVTNAKLPIPDPALRASAVNGECYWPARHFYTLIPCFYILPLQKGWQDITKMPNVDMFIVHSLILLSSYLRMKGKLTEGLLETFLGLSSGLLPVENAPSMNNMHIMVGLHCHWMPKWLCIDWRCSERLCWQCVTGIGIFKQWPRCASMLHYPVFIIKPSVNHTSIIIIIEREAKWGNYSYQLEKEGVRAVLIE